MGSRVLLVKQTVDCVISNSCSLIMAIDFMKKKINNITITLHMSPNVCYKGKCSKIHANVLKHSLYQLENKVSDNRCCAKMCIWLTDLILQKIIKAFGLCFHLSCQLQCCPSLSRIHLPPPCTILIFLQIAPTLTPNRGHT